MFLNCSFYDGFVKQSEFDFKLPITTLILKAIGFDELINKVLSEANVRYRYQRLLTGTIPILDNYHFERENI